MSTIMPQLFTMFIEHINVVLLKVSLTNQLKKETLQYLKKALDAKVISKESYMEKLQEHKKNIDLVLFSHLQNSFYFGV